MSAAAVQGMLGPGFTQADAQVVLDVVRTTPYAAEDIAAAARMLGKADRATLQACGEVACAWNRTPSFVAGVVCSG